ncbi:hypothetical protein V6N12_074601 [Hibiscus sabdariffa]|uniref:Cation/H+ exchanger transmembrane domain-containing protein n=1 Tax=Hibiscus sabdariffa TaxID=183260 RepID=A0ABR2BXQ8_9ROSI
MAMSAVAVNNVAAWVLLALAIALSGTNSFPVVSLWVFLCGPAFVLGCTLIVPHIFKWMAHRYPEGELVKELAQSWGLLILVITIACFGKIVGTVSVSLLCKVPFNEALALRFLKNTKGLVELIVLNIGKDRKVLNDQTFAKCMIIDKTLGCLVYIVGRTTS